VKPVKKRNSSPQQVGGLLVEILNISNDIYLKNS
jgi:hypothetical protein